MRRSIVLALSFLLINVTISIASYPTAADIEQPTAVPDIARSCDKMRVDAGHAWVDPITTVAVVACVRTWAYGRHPQLAPPNWHESVAQATQICNGFVAQEILDSAVDEDTGRPIISFAECLIEELRP